MSTPMNDVSAPMDARSIQGRAYELLKGMIDEGRLQAGERLLEAEVAKAFGISRSPARHALRLLCEDKLIRESAGRGYEVVGRARAGSRVQAIRPARRAVLEPMQILSVPQWERMYGELERELCTHMIFSGVRIVEERVAEHFAVSRTVVRDVLARMHSVGLVSKDALGHWVAPQVTPAKTHHLYELRWLLEPEALRQAAPHVPAGYVERARATAVDALDGFPREGFDTDVVEHDLHVTLLSHCPNEDILHALARTRVLFVPTRYLFDPVLHIPLDLIEDALREHVHIYDLLLTRRPAQAAKALYDHLRHADDRWLKRFQGAAALKPSAMPPYLLAV
ncbi:GntR family transcriptional regulator [Bordetella bronchialis]|nr:GntR family transcriptional regulator [Bordetella bronchialis]